MNTANPNPRYWREPQYHWVLNFEQIVGINRGDFFDPKRDPNESHIFGVILASGQIQYLAIPQGRFLNLLNAYESWLTER